MTTHIITGSVLKYPDNDINTDVIWPGKYTYVQMEPDQMKAHAMETFDPEFQRKVINKQILVVGSNMGCGSSREQASECIKYCGIKVIIAKSFARIFYRNSINIGLPLIESMEAVNAIQDGDTVEVDLEQGSIIINGTHKIMFPKYPSFVLDLIKNDGLINTIKQQQGGN